MAIVKMKKLRVMAMAGQRDALLRQLLRLGCVEISEPDARLADPAWAALLRRDSSALAEKKKSWIDFNAGVLVEGKTMDEVSGEFFDYILRLANGEVQTNNEKHDFREIAIFKDGVML